MMHLDEQACMQAWHCRDPRFDGRFFIGVVTTGIYCRPICPVRPPKPENVRFFPTAAAAARAGYRPCLRCRPECSPASPAWQGTASTVARALRLIDSGWLEERSLQQLSDKLGMSSRHLSRLFQKHLGASVQSVAHTRRLHFAKKLIDETGLPMAEVAFASGFGSVRRFNAALRQVYGRSPTQLRKAAQSSPPQNGSAGLQLDLRYRPPYDWPSILQFLSLRATPGVEAVDEGCYRRTIALEGHCGWIEVRPHERQHCLALTVWFPSPQALLKIVARVRGQFDLDADPVEIARRLAQSPLLKESVSAFPGMRLPGSWDLYELVVRAILGQQVSVAAACTLSGRLAESFGESSNGPPHPRLSRLFPTPQALAQADVSSIGIPRKRAQAIQKLSRAVAEGRLLLDPCMDYEEFVQLLKQQDGIGEWTAQYAAMRGLRHPDAFPAGDLVLLKSSALENPTPRTLTALASQWRPWRAYAALHLWKQAGARENGDRQN